MLAGDSSSSAQWKPFALRNETWQNWPFSRFLSQNFLTIAVGVSFPPIRWNCRLPRSLVFTAQRRRCQPSGVVRHGFWSVLPGLPSIVGSTASFVCSYSFCTTSSLQFVYKLSVCQMTLTPHNWVRIDHQKNRCCSHFADYLCAERRQQTPSPKYLLKDSGYILSNDNKIQQKRITFDQLRMWCLVLA